MPQLMWLGDKDATARYFNRRWYEYTGLPTGTSDEVVWLTAIHPDDRPAMAAAWARGKPLVEPLDLRFRCRRHDGAWRWFDAHITPLFDRTGAHTSWLGKVVEVETAERTVDPPLISSMVGVITDALAHASSLTAALSAGVSGLMVHLGITSAQVWMYGHGTSTLVPVASAGRDVKADLGPQRMPLERTPIACIATGRKPYRTNDVASDPLIDQAWAGGPDVVAFAGYPLLAEHELVGVLAVFAPRPLDDDTALAIGAIADAMALRIARERTLDSLQRSEARLQLVLQATRDAIWDCDLITDQVVWNQGLSELIGSPPDQLSSDTGWWVGNVHPEDRPALVASIEQLKAGGGREWKAEYRVRRADGNYARVIDRGFLIRDATGKPIRMIGAMQDITQRWRAERSLRVLAEAGARLAAATDLHDAGKRVMDLLVPEHAMWAVLDLVRDDGTIERAASAHRDPARVADLARLGRDYPPDPTLTIGVAQVVRSGVPEWVDRPTAAQVRASCYDDDHAALIESLGVGAYGRLPLTARGRTLGTLTIVRGPDQLPYDADDRELMLGIARRAAKFIDGVQLLAAARRSEQELRAVVTALQRSNDDLDRFAYVAGHDLKAPLRGIATISQWIAEDLGKELRPETAEHLRMLRSRVRQLELLIEGALQYSRAGRGEVAPEPVDTGGLVREVFELLAPPRTATLTVAPGMPIVVASRVMLQQVFLNLVGNAVKYGGGEHARIEVAATDEGTTWAFTVTDQGPGIAPEHHERIWELFRTVAPRDDRASTGIGLAIVRKIVQRNGGETSVRSTPGEGATFRFTWAKGPCPKAG